MKVWYRADDPEKGKVRIWKFIERKIRQGNGYEYILWRGYIWVVWCPDGSYRIKYQLGRRH